MQQLPVIICFIIIISLITGCIIMGIIMKRITYSNKKLLDCLAYKNNILEENSKIRHEYHNIFQILINLIEEENLKALLGYKNTLIEKTYSMNRNSLIQLGKIKDVNLFYTMFQLYQEAISGGWNLNIYVQMEIKKGYPLSLMHVLMEWGESIHKIELESLKNIDLYIRENKQGISFRFDQEYHQNSENLKFSSLESVAKKNTDYTYNLFQKGNHLIQEIMYSGNKNVNNK
jgi:hypothetical protein